MIETARIAKDACSSRTTADIICDVSKQDSVECLVSLS